MVETIDFSVETIDFSILVYTRVETKILEIT
jgi:hypothetical protein